MAAVDPPFEDSDLSQLANSNPGSGRPWRDSTTGALIVGALGTFGITQAAADARYAALSHTHTIANVTGLQAALDGKQAAGSYAAAVHSHAIGDVTGLQSALDGKVNDTGDTITGPLTVSQGTGFSTLQVINDGNNSPGSALCVGSPSYGFMVNGANYDAFAIARFSTVVPLTIRGAASQTADLQRWQNSAGSTLVSVSAGGNIVTGGSVRATTINPLAYDGAPATCSITASGGSSGTMVLSGGGAQQISLADTKLTIPSAWSIDFSSGNWNQTVDARVVRNAAGQMDIRANSGLRVRDLLSTGWANIQCGSVASSGNVDVSNGLYVGSELLPTGASTTLGSTTQMWSNVVHRGSHLNYNTGFSGNTNYERGVSRWNANVYEVGTEKAGTGAGRDFRLVSEGYLKFKANGVDVWQCSSGNGIELLSGSLFMSNVSNSIRWDTTSSTPRIYVDHSTWGPLNLTSSNGVAIYNNLRMANCNIVSNEDLTVGPNNNNRNLTLRASGTGSVIVSHPLQLNSAYYIPPATFATLPSASAQTGARYRITDRSQRECYSDGTNWRFAADDSIVT